ncbi:MAG: TIM barrel protein [Pirellulales bacterium]|nr:TIM barrel protein [Pirellulales bacterium]
MVTLGVCLETVFTDLPVEQRIAKIAEAGYAAVEFWHPEGTFDGSQVDFDQPKDAAALSQACIQHGLVLNDFAMHAWDGSIGGSPVKAEDREIYLAQIRKMIEFGKAAGCDKGITLSGTVDPELSRGEMRANLEKALAEAVELAVEADFTLLLEPLNTLVDHPGYYLDSSSEGFEIVRAINSPNLKLLYDVYHMQIMEGNLIATIEKNIDQIGHFHSAGVPGRAELFGTELDYPTIVQAIQKTGYQGAFGLEYFPKMTDHGESLARILEYIQS